MAAIALDSKKSTAPLKIRINRRGWAVFIGIPVFVLTVAAAFFFTMLTSEAQASSKAPQGVETVDLAVVDDRVWD